MRAPRSLHPRLAAVPINDPSAKFSVVHVEFFGK